MTSDHNHDAGHSHGAGGRLDENARAIVRKPGPNFHEAITAAGLGRPDFEKALAQHAAYCDALKQCGLAVTVLAADPLYPDGTFVEDAAIVTERCAIITHMSAPSRCGEQAVVADALSRFRRVEHLTPPAAADGGDVMRVGDHFFIGISGRTDAGGARQLSDVLGRYGYTASTVPVAGCLHLKTGVTCVGDNHLLATAEFAGRAELASFDIIRTPPDEPHAANCVLINGRLLAPAGCQATRRLLAPLGRPIIEVDISEFQKMDGGLTCLSLRF